MTRTQTQPFLILDCTDELCGGGGDGDVPRSRLPSTKLKTPTRVKTSLLRKCANAVPVFETQSTGYLYSPFLNGTRGLFSLSRAGLVCCRACCQSAAQEESVMCDLHLRPSRAACLERTEGKRKKKKVTAEALGPSLAQSRPSSSCSEATGPREPVKLQPFHPCLIKPTAIKARMGSFRLSMCPLRCR